MKKDRALWIKAGDVVRYAGWEYVVGTVYADPLRFDLVPSPGSPYAKSAISGLAFQKIDAVVATKLPPDLLAQDYTHVYAPPAAEARLKLDDVNADLAAAEQRINDGLVALGDATDANRRLQAKVDALEAERESILLVVDSLRERILRSKSALG